MGKGSGPKVPRAKPTLRSSEQILLFLRESKPELRWLRQKGGPRSQDLVGRCVWEWRGEVGTEGHVARSGQALVPPG